MADPGSPITASPAQLYGDQNVHSWRSRITGQPYSTGQAPGLLPGHPINGGKEYRIPGYSERKPNGKPLIFGFPIQIYLYGPSSPIRNKEVFLGFPFRFTNSIEIETYRFSLGFPLFIQWVISPYKTEEVILGKPRKRGFSLVAGNSEVQIKPATTAGKCVLSWTYHLAQNRTLFNRPHTSGFCDRWGLHAT
jgi:hypothetical protein